jgi:hypothetical protein
MFFWGGGGIGEPKEGNHCCFPEWSLTNQPMVVLLPYLQSVQGTQHINTRRLTQDILENLLSHVRVFECSYGHLLLTDFWYILY